MNAYEIKEVAKDLAIRLKGKKHSLCIEAIRMSEMNAYKIRKEAYPIDQYPDMAPIDKGGGKYQEVRPVKLPEGFDPNTVEGCPGDEEMLTEWIAQCDAEGVL